MDIQNKLFSNIKHLFSHSRKKQQAVKKVFLKAFTTLGVEGYMTQISGKQRGLSSAGRWTAVVRYGICSHVCKSSVSSLQMVSKFCSNYYTSGSGLCPAQGVISQQFVP